MRNTAIILLLANGLTSLSICQGGEKYESNWESIGNYRVPDWYQDAKFGIWPHWGVYSVPAYRGDHAAEWYGRWIHCVEKEGKVPNHRGKLIDKFYGKRGLKTAGYHRETYGPVDEFGYHDLVDHWKAEKFNADAWAQMAVDSGAKFFCMMAQHHDSFSLYGSDHTQWDSVDKGPRRDLCLEMKQAAAERGLRFGVSNHMAWNYQFFSFYHHNDFAKLAGHEKYADLYSYGVVDEEYLRRWWLRTTEVIDKLEPDLYYFDWGWNRDPWRQGNYHARFASHFYNRAIEQGKGSFGEPGVVLCSKQNDIPAHCGIRDLERGRMKDIQPNVWQTDTSISIHSWGYSTEDSYHSADTLIDMLVDIVSKNGVMMLNFGPKADGTVPTEYYERLMAMGDWLEICGEAIYATRPFAVYGENPPEEVSSPEINARIRFSRDKDSSILYAIALDWPGESLTIRTLAKEQFDSSSIQSVRLVGTSQPLIWHQDSKGLHISMPDKPVYDLAYPVRIQFVSKIPELVQ